MWMLITYRKATLDSNGLYAEGILAKLFNQLSFVHHFNHPVETSVIYSLQ